MIINIYFPLLYELFMMIFREIYQEYDMGFQRENKNKTKCLSKQQYIDIHCGP